jgi:hypothetical protein
MSAQLLASDFITLGHETPPGDLRTLRELVRSTHAREVIEVGSWVGSSALALARPGVRVHCIDHWEGTPGEEVPREGVPSAVSQVTNWQDPFQVFCHNVRPQLFKSIFPHRGTSSFFQEIWPHPVDLVFIDAAHTYEEVIQDLGWARHLKPGGLLCGHDYDVFPGVTRAVDEIGADGTSGAIWWKMIE